MNQTYTSKIAIKDIYGMKNPEIPQGYEALEFRPFENGEIWLSSVTFSAITATSRDKDFKGPRIILKKLPELRRFVVEFQRDSSLDFCGDFGYNLILADNEWSPNCPEFNRFKFIREITK